MSGFLSLGGPSSAFVVRVPARLLDTPWVPNVDRPVLVVACVTMQTGGLDEAAIDLRVDGVAVASAFTGGGMPNGVSSTLVALVPPGHAVELITNPVSGAPQFGLLLVSEVTL